MRRENFEKRHEKRWRKLEALVRRAQTSRRSKNNEGLASLPTLYRKACRDLALAKHRHYGIDLVRRLNQLALSGHNLLYRHTFRSRGRFARFVGSEFPLAVRARWRNVALCSVLFYGSYLLVLLLVTVRPDLVYSIVGAETVANIEEMYQEDAEAIGRERGSDTDLMMFGFYIYNNIGIAFRTYAGGLLLGLGAMFALLFNGIFFGAISAHINTIGYHETFYSFVIGHGAFELNAIVLAGVAGMELGFAVLAPGRFTRGRALVMAGKRSLPIVFGATGMLLIAAFVEAFWSSSSTVTPATKFAVGGIFWFLVLLYFAAAGRRRGT